MKKHLSIKYKNDDRTSSFTLEEGFVKVLGIIPHGSKIYFDHETLVEMREWIDKQLIEVEAS